MGKIGDLWVKLGLKKDDLTKGLNESKKQVSSFGQGFSKVASLAKVGWAAIGAAAIKVGQQVIQSNQRMADAFARGTEQMKAGWDVFLNSLASWNWDNFIGRLRGAVNEAKDLANALDAQFEVNNSLIIAKAQNRAELEQLSVDMVDPNKTAKERADAARKYLEMVKPLYDKEINSLKQLRDARIDAFIANKGVNATGLATEERYNLFETFLKNGAPNASAIADEYKNQLGSKRNGNSYGRSEEIIRSLLGSQDDLYVQFAKELALAYNDRANDADITPLVTAITDYHNSLGALVGDNKRVERALNTATSQMRKEVEDTVEEAKEPIKDIRSELLDPLTDSLRDFKATAQNVEMPDLFPKDAVEEQKKRSLELIAQIESVQMAANQLDFALEQGLVAGLDELANAFAGVEGSDAKSVVKAILSPLADAAVSAGMLIMTSGEGIEMFKKSLSSLNGTTAIAAGAALVALGVATKAGLQAIGQRGGSSSAGYTSSSQTSTEIETQELIVYVKGQISGSDIKLAYDRQANKWAR